MKLGLKSRQSDSRASTEHHTASCTVCQSRVGIGVRDRVPGGNAGYQRDPGWDAEVAAERVPLLPLPPLSARVLCQRVAIYIPAAADRQLGAGRRPPGMRRR